MKIDDISLRVIKDSRGHDTLEVNLKSDNFAVVASVPSGKSKGKNEVVSIDSHQALQKLKSLRKEIQAEDFSSVSEFDEFLIRLDGTGDKSNLGGNLILVLSIAFTKLLAKANGLETFELIAEITGKKNPGKFPFLLFNLIGGGLHAENSLPFQEYLLVTRFDSPAKGLAYAKSIADKLKVDIGKNFGEVRMGDEGAFAVDSRDPRLGLEVLNRNIDDSNVSLALDVAASTFFENGSYNVGGKIMSRDDLCSYYQLLATNPSTSLGTGCHLLSIEDPFDEEDWQGFSEITTKLGGKVWVVGDDLTTTNPKRIKLAHEKGAVNTVIIKPNQIGSVTETIQAAMLAKSYGWKIIVSHRSGETMDSFIADLAFGLGADGLKSGAPTQKERLVKYERLIEIESSPK